jgi:cyclophilin family peptidyl-prolyl cis-trans isomerase
MLDAEASLEHKELLDWALDYKASLEKEGKKQRKVVENWPAWKDDTPNSQFLYELNTLEWLRQKYVALGEIVDSLQPQVDSAEMYFQSIEDAKREDPDSRVSSVIPVHWQEAKKYWSNILDFISLHELPYKTIKRLYLKVKKAKKQKSISSYFYFHLMFWCTTQLGYLSERRGILAYGAKCKVSSVEGSMWNPLPIPEEDKVYSTSYDDRFYGEMNFNIESAIDLMDKARSLAAQCNIDTEQAFYSILEEQEYEQPSKWIPTL